MNRKIDDDQLRALVAAGLSDACVAARFAVRGSTVGAARRRLGLPARGGERRFSPAGLAAAGATGRAHLEVMHGGLRRKAAALATKYGLPPMRPRMVVILLTLLDGPLSRRQVCDRTAGFDSGFGHNRELRTPVGHKATQRCISRLVAGGWVVHVRRAGGPKRKEIPDLYLLSSKSMEVFCAAGKGNPGDAPASGA